MHIQYFPEIYLNIKLKILDYFYIPKCIKPIVYKRSKHNTEKGTFGIAQNNNKLCDTHERGFSLLSQLCLPNETLKIQLI